MDKPTCRVCLAKHWSSEPHVFESRKPNSEDKPAVAAPRKPNAECVRCKQLEREVAELRAKLDGRKAYQREYMRKRRSERAV